VLPPHPDGRSTWVPRRLRHRFGAFNGDVPTDQLSLNFQKIDVVFTSRIDGSTADLSTDVNGNTT
jgi:hypothetical protein